MFLCMMISMLFENKPHGPLTALFNYAILKILFNPPVDLTEYFRRKATR